MDRLIEGWVNGWMDGRIGGWMDGWINTWLNGWVNGRIGGWLTGWLNRPHVFLYVGTMSDPVIPLEDMFPFLKTKLPGDHVYPRILSS